MPAPTVVCDICHQTVNKRQTVSIGKDKRVCKSHTEAQEQAQNAQQQRHKQEQKGRNRPKFTHHEPKLTLNPTCWNCQKEGLRSDNFFYQMLLLREAYEITYNEKLNWVFPREEDIVKLQKAFAPLQNLRCLWVIKYDPKKHNFLLNDFHKQMADMMGVFMLCDKCCETFKVERHDPLKHLTDNNEKALAILYTLGSIVADEVKSQVTKEIAAKN